MLRRMCALPLRWIGSMAVAARGPSARPAPAAAAVCMNWRRVRNMAVCSRKDSAAERAGARRIEQIAAKCQRVAARIRSGLLVGRLGVGEGADAGQGDAHRLRLALGQLLGGLLVDVGE